MSVPHGVENTGQCVIMALAWALYCAVDQGGFGLLMLLFYNPIFYIAFRVAFRVILGYPDVFGTYVPPRQL